MISNKQDPVTRGEGSANEGNLYFETPGMIPGAMEPQGEKESAPAAEAKTKTKPIPKGGAY